MRKLLLFSILLAFAAVSCGEAEPETPDNPTPAEQNASVTNVKLDKEKATLTVGQTMKLTATVYPANAKNKNVSWRSNGEKYATVSSDGTVTALAPGKANIICTTEDQEKTAYCEVTVEAPVIAVTGVSFGVSEITVNEGDSFPLVPVFQPDDATERSVSWKSDDPAIAAIADDGTVTALKAGTTAVSCTTKDGGFVAKCTVHIIPKGDFQIFFDGDEAPSSITYKLSDVPGDTLAFRLFNKTEASFLDGKDLEIKSSSDGVAQYSGCDEESGIVKAVGDGTATLTFSYKGKMVGSMILYVLPKPEYVVYHGTIDEENEILEGSIFRFNAFNTRDFILYDKNNKTIITPSSPGPAASAESSDVSIASAYPVTSPDREDEWTVWAKNTGRVTVALKYGDFTRKFDVIITRYCIYCEGSAMTGSSFYQYTMGTKENNLLKFQMYDLVSKTFVPVSQLKIESVDPTAAVVDSYTETECLVKIKKAGTAILICSDVCDGVECYINVVRVTAKNPG